MAELPAGRGDVAASARPDVGVDSSLPEFFLKSSNVLCGRSAEGESRHLVVTNQVDVASQGLGMRCQLSGVLDPVIESTKQDVLDGDFSTGPLDRSREALRPWSTVPKE